MIRFGGQIEVQAMSIEQHFRFRRWRAPLVLPALAYPAEQHKSVNDWLINRAMGVYERPDWTKIW